MGSMAMGNDGRHDLARHQGTWKLARGTGRARARRSGLKDEVEELDDDDAEQESEIE